MPDLSRAAPPTPETVLAQTRAWVDAAVIGLNLCPFAKAPQAKGLIRYALSTARDPEALLADLHAELQQLARTPAEACETTLLVHPWVLQDFLDFNDFLDAAEGLLDALDLNGVLQIASFHPDYQFAGTDGDDIGNATNRSPWPTLHLIREASLDRAVAAIPEAEQIYEANIRTLQQLGHAGWQALCAQIATAADATDRTTDPTADPAAGRAAAPATGDCDLDRDARCTAAPRDAGV